MIRLVTPGRLTNDFAKGLLAAPEDREPVVREVIEAVGGNPLPGTCGTSGEITAAVVAAAKTTAGGFAASSDNCPYAGMPKADPISPEANC